MITPLSGEEVTSSLCLGTFFMPPPLGAQPSPRRAERGAGQTPHPGGAGCVRLLLFFTGHRPFLMTRQTQGSTSSGDTLRCSFWSLNPPGFIYTCDENRMCSTELRRGMFSRVPFGRQTSCWLFVLLQIRHDALIFFFNSWWWKLGVLFMSGHQDVLGISSSRTD